MFEIKFGENEISSVFKGFSIYLSGPDQPPAHSKILVSSY